MIKQKEVYTSPLTEVLVVRFEGTLLQASQFSSKGTEMMSVDAEEDF